MIEARVPWTLEGPSDSITFNTPGSPWVLTEKPRTAVDDRRDVYDYPLDDGSYVGDAYAGARMWSLKGMLAAASHAERNTELQRMQALLNSLRRADGLLKWEPDGFPAVQSTVRRMGSLDYSGGANKHVPIAFNLIAGDPRVYSQAETVSSVAPATASLGSELLSANAQGLETSIADWVSTSPSYLALAQGATAQAGTKSLQMSWQVGFGTFAGYAQLVSGISCSPGTVYRLEFYIRTPRPTSEVSAIQSQAQISFFNSGGSLIGAGSVVTNGNTTLVPNTWQLVTYEITAPAGAATMKPSVGFSVTGGISGSASFPSVYAFVDAVSLKAVTYSSSLTVDNDGDAETNPVLLITGPAGNPVVANTTRGQSLPLDATVAAGGANAVTIDSAAREIWIGPTLSTASNLYGAKGARDPFIQIQPGSNVLTFSASGTSGDSLLTITIRDAWMP